MNRFLTCILVNPAAGRGAARRKLPELQRLAGRAGVAVEVTDGLDDLTRRVRRAVAGGAERLIVAGGDGTVHHTIQEMAGRATALAVLPVGSGNDTAATLGMSQDLGEAFRQALEAPVDRIDLGRLTPVDGAVPGRWFIGVAGVGFDSEVAHYTNEKVRWIRGRAVYPYGVVRALGSYRPPEVTLRFTPEGADEEVTVQRQMILAAFANTHRFGGGMRVAPDARPDDGLLDVVTVRKIPKWRLLTVFPRVYSGTHLSHPAVEVVRTRQVRVSLDREMVVQGDGEPMGPVTGGGVTVEVVPGALAVARLPDTAAGR